MDHGPHQRIELLFGKGDEHERGRHERNRRHGVVLELRAALNPVEIALPQIAAEKRNERNGQGERGVMRLRLEAGHVQDEKEVEAGMRCDHQQYAGDFDLGSGEN